MNLTWRYKLLPTRKQRRSLEQVLDVTRNLYNAALEQRISAYQSKRKTLSLYEQYSEIKNLRADPELGMSQFPTTLMRWPLQRVDEAFKSFFKRVKKRDGRAGFPRFRSAQRFDTFGLVEWSGVRIEKGRFCLNGLGGSRKGSGIRIHMHRPIPHEAKFLAATVTRKGDAWYLNISIRFEDAESLELAFLSEKARFSPDQMRGWDWGLENAMTSDQGLTLERVRIGERHAARVKKAQRRVSAAPRGSKGRKRWVKELARAKRREAEARVTRDHQLAARVVKESPFVALEKLDVRRMTSRVAEPDFMPKNSQGMNRSILDGSPARLRQFISYKAERAGGRCIEVNPRNTSQTCSGCGARVVKTLKQRWHDCSNCGLSVSRDVNAARNIRGLGIALMLEGMENGGVVAPRILVTQRSDERVHVVNYEQLCCPSGQ